MLAKESRFPQEVVLMKQWLRRHIKRIFKLYDIEDIPTDPRGIINCDICGCWHPSGTGASSHFFGNYYHMCGQCADNVDSEDNHEALKRKFPFKMTSLNI